ncbi:MAG: AAA family ATPase [Ignavibacteriae bacterium]|nr:AAA family ATPase [Ignavibacteriota bacterium]
MTTPSREQLETRIAEAAPRIQGLIDNVNLIIRGQRPTIELVLTALFAGGHVLIEDYPGSGKTTLAKTLSLSIGGGGTPSTFKRIQFTPDLLPMDIVGFNFFDAGKNAFVFKQGPVFSNFLLADEINRASPKVQSALLECMAEKQVTVDERTYKLENLFFIVATQNPIDSEGTYPLPWAQLDRFYFKLPLGYVDYETDLEILGDLDRILDVQGQVHPVITADEVVALQNLAFAVHCDETIIRAVTNLIHRTRESKKEINVGASTRAGIYLLKLIKAHALVAGRAFATEDDFKAVAYWGLHHRLVYANRKAGEDVLRALVDTEVEKLRNVVAR